MKKAGIEYLIGRDLNPDFTGLADTFSAKYKLKGDTDWTDVEGSFEEDGAGVYRLPITYPSKGVYTVLIESTDARVNTMSALTIVDDASIDDVKEVVDALVTTLDAVKTQVDTLDEETVNGISDKVIAVDDKLVELKGLLSDTDDDAVVSLRELLQDITDAGSDRDGVISALTGYTDGVEAMLQGLEYVDADGNTVSADDSYGLKDIYDAITAGNDDSTVADKVDAVKAVVDANKALLEDDTYGLSKLKDLIDHCETVSLAKGDDIIAILNDEDTGIVALRDSLQTKLDSMDSKLDTIVANTTDLGTILI